MPEVRAREPAGRPTAPRHAVVVLLDSLNRHLLGCYGSDEFDTPNLDRFARTALRFDRHVAGSLPCIPARHDILCGALDFLWKPWGSIEVWEDAITLQLQQAGVTTMLVSDHPHLFEVGGENFHTDFSAWEYVRGHEGDPWRTRPDPSWVGAPALPAAPAPHLVRPYDTSRTWFRSEGDFPGPRTMATAAQWLELNAGHHDRFLLFVDEFDPHEPFDTPEPWASRYDPDWQGPRLIWPPYAVDGVARGVLSEREGRHIRANYGAKLSMIDHWFGRVLDAVDRAGLAPDTAIIVCTDHGHYLGERDLWGKPAVPVYEPMGRIPLLVSWPGVAPGVVDALTTSVDLHATLADLFGVAPGHRIHGRSLAPLITGEVSSVRDGALAGYWGREIHVTDGRHKYGRGPVGDNAPLSMWSNRWSTMPIHGLPGLRLPRPDGRAWLDRMPGSSVPVIRQPFAPGDPVPYWAAGTRPGSRMLFDLDADPGEEHDLVGTPLEAEMIDLLRAALDEVEAPAEHLARLGIA
ncbi:MAG: sulfatase-like hydrolase/transferase [Acidimicrobiales bacterium]|nr:sulfatase-like hydrolase/transferase [Acidimicrobiales bacterium]